MLKLESAVIQEDRPYQAKAKEEIRQNFINGIKKVMLQLPTGGGKTKIFCDILKKTSGNQKKAIMVVKGKDLVDQASQRLFRENVEHGCLQGNHWNKNINASIQLCSIDTLYRRKLIPKADLVVIDEAHFATSPSFKWFIEHYEDKFILGVSATPHAAKGLRHIAETVVYPITIRELIEQGYLVPPRYYAPSKPNLDGLAIDSKTGDYKSRSLVERMQEAKIYGDIPKYYTTYAQDRPTVCFAVSIEHSKMLVEQFKANSISAEHIEADTPKAEREAVLKRLETGETKVVCNVGILCVGVDMPYVSCVISARPTKSYNLWIQQLGRGTRPHPGKEDFIVLDHANNIMEHGFIEDEQICDLDGYNKSDSVSRPITCDECFHVFCPIENFQEKNQTEDVGRDLICPQCGHDNKQENSKGSAERSFETNEEAELIEIKLDSSSEKTIINNYISQKVREAKILGYSRGYLYSMVKKRFGEKVAKENWYRIQNSVAGSR